MPSKSILLIEHEVSLRDVLGDCLTELGGWEVTPSESILEGIRLCESKRPDAILVDASTAENDALILIEQLKQYSVEQAVPILLISSRANWFTLSEFRQMGFSGAIGKPFNPATLSAQVSRLISLEEPTS
ncbi:response regulator [Nodosilinea sp. LEGE 07088]|uniref:response regulator n=1 Tax=Nodosilinea sp. LEGE 07088 TaxID=2777968 RepID=UPI00187E1C43|nr:response regulator [Nodosilinea sp. LEGE 07088]MBE9141219.1 response regulator [Nodosilinea sp. LEGE 07088]